MRTVVAHSIKSVREVNTRFGLKAIAEIEVQGEPKKELWMSVKQGDKLVECFDKLNQHGGYSTKRAECHIILDEGEKGERFVWCGIHTPKFSELKFLEEKFGVKCESPYIGRYDLEAEAPAEPNESLKDE